MHSFSTQNIAIIIFLISFSLTNPWGNGITQASDTISSDTISIDVSERPLKEVLGKITAATGYEITINEKLAEKPLTIKLEGIAIESGLKRIMNSIDVHNTVILTDEENKTIEIVVLGSFSAPIVTMINEAEELGMTMAEIEKLHKKQLTETSTNYTEIPPSESGKPGMTMAELEKLHKKQLTETSPSYTEIPPSESGKPDMTFAGIEKLHKKQLTETSTNYTEIPPSESGKPGMTMAELEKLHKKQIAEISNNSDDITASEIEASDNIKNN